MPTIMEPWPPVDTTQPLPFDQGGCCGPVDTCGRHRKLELRYDVIGTRVGGPVGALWLWIGTGQLLLASPPNWDWFEGRSTGIDFPLAAVNFLSLRPFHDLTTLLLADCVLPLDLLGTIIVEGHGEVSLEYCGGSFSLPATVTGGPPDPPDTIVITPLRWYQTPAYPYLG